MVVIMVFVWVVLFVLTAWAFWRGEIFLAKEEDILKDVFTGNEVQEKVIESRDENSAQGSVASSSDHSHDPRSYFSHV